MPMFLQTRHYTARLETGESHRTVNCRPDVLESAQRNRAIGFMYSEETIPVTSIMLRYSLLKSTLDIPDQGAPARGSLTTRIWTWRGFRLNLYTNRPRPMVLHTHETSCPESLHRTTSLLRTVWRLLRSLDLIRRVIS